MKHILKINDVTETVNCSAGKHTFSFEGPTAIKKAKAALRKNNNLWVIPDGADSCLFGTSSQNVVNFKEVPKELIPYWNEYVAPVNTEHVQMLNFIHKDSVKLKPEMLMMNETKWKYLVRSAMRGKNIMMTGAAGGGKTMAAKAVAGQVASKAAKKATGGDE